MKKIKKSKIEKNKKKSKIWKKNRRWKIEYEKIEYEKNRKNRRNFIFAAKIDMRHFAGFLNDWKLEFW